MHTTSTTDRLASCICGWSRPARDNGHAELLASGHLYVSDLGAGKIASNGMPVAPRPFTTRTRRAAPKPLGRGAAYFKPQYLDSMSLTWKDIQTACETEEAAVEVARAKAPKGATKVRAMYVGAGGRDPLPAVAR